MNNKLSEANKILETEFKSWEELSENVELSEQFIRDFKDDVDWEHISMYQKLSDPFIRDFKDKVDLDWISKHQRLSESFIREFKNKVDWEYISMYQKLSNDFIEEFHDKLNMGLIEDSWFHKDVEFKKKQVTDTKLYECHGDYFIAYKGIRSDRCSNFNFQFKYEKGETYYTFCDCSNNENSFGFSVWTEDRAKEYCDEMLVRCKVRYEDVCRVVHGGGKIR